MLSSLNKVNQKGYFYHQFYNNINIFAFQETDKISDTAYYNNVIRNKKFIIESHEINKANTAQKSYQL